MNHYLLHISESGARETPAWQEELTAKGIVVLRARTAREGCHYCHAYPLMMVLFEIDQADAATCEAVAALAEASGKEGRQWPVIGVARERLEIEACTALAKAGLSDLIGKDDPERFVLWRVQMLAALEDLRRFEQTKTDVSELASRTRTYLHDLSQPLSAVQGRLQLLAAKCPSNDPNAQTFNELVRLIFQVTHQVMEIQQIHRQYS